MLNSLDEIPSVLGSAKAIQSEIETLYSRNKDRPQAWLNELTKFFVSKCRIVEKSIPRSEYLKTEIIPIDKSIEKLLVETYKDSADKYIKKYTRSTLYHETTLNMADEACHGSLNTGHKLVLQVLAKNFKDDSIKAISDRINFNASQANAYRSNPATAIPLLWSMGLPFLNHRTSLVSSNAIEVFESIMLPLIDNKPLAPLILNFLDGILKETKSAGIKKAIFSPTTVTKLYTIAYSNNLDTTDKLKLKNLVAQISLTSKSFQESLSLLSSNNVDFTSFVLSKQYALLNTASSAECCQIWQLSYEKVVNETCILLEYLINNPLDNKNLENLKRATKQFSNQNKKIINQPKLKNSIKKSVNLCEELCVALQTGTMAKKGKSNAKNNQKKSQSSKNNKRSFISTSASIFFKIFKKLLWWNILLFVAMDMYGSNFQWKRMKTRNFIKKSLPFKTCCIEKNIINNLNNGWSFVSSTSSLGYSKLRELSPEHFQIVENNLDISYEKAYLFTKTEVTPQLNKFLIWYETKLVEGYIWYKEQNFTEQLSLYTNMAKVQAEGLLNSVKTFSENFINDFPAYVDGAKIALVRAQIYVGKNIQRGLKEAKKQWANLKVQLDKNETLKLYWTVAQNKVLQFYVFVMEKTGPILTSTFETCQVYISKALEAIKPVFDQLVGQIERLILQVQMQIEQLIQG